jgi:DNA-binding protein H-NS
LVSITPKPNGKPKSPAPVSSKNQVGRRKLKDQNFAMMSANELWILHEEIRAVLSAKLDAEKHELNRRLARIKRPYESSERARRPYPKVYPKYRNPERPSETWSGRGKQPRWVAAHLGSGKKFDDLLISRTH